MNRVDKRHTIIETTGHVQLVKRTNDIAIFNHRDVVFVNLGPEPTEFRQGYLAAVVPLSGRYNDCLDLARRIASILNTDHYHCADGCEKSAGRLVCVRCGAPFVECTPEVCDV